MARPIQLRSNGVVTVDAGLDLKRALTRLARAQKKTLSDYAKDALGDHVKRCENPKLSS